MTIMDQFVRDNLSVGNNIILVTGNAREVFAHALIYDLIFKGKNILALGEVFRNYTELLWERDSNLNGDVSPNRRTFINSNFFHILDPGFKDWDAFSLAHARNYSAVAIESYGLTPDFINEILLPKNTYDKVIVIMQPEDYGQFTPDVKMHVDFTTEDGNQMLLTQNNNHNVKLKIHRGLLLTNY
jgi:hypothetical protein